MTDRLDEAKRLPVFHSMIPNAQLDAYCAMADAAERVLALFDTKGVKLLEGTPIFDLRAAVDRVRRRK